MESNDKRTDNRGSGRDFMIWSRTQYTYSDSEEEDYIRIAWVATNYITVEP
jgi:hypothetical protein